jgi:hypothetical protein
VGLQVTELEKWCHEIAWEEVKKVGEEGLKFKGAELLLAKRCAIRSAEMMRTKFVEYILNLKSDRALQVLAESAAQIGRREAKEEKK